MRKHFLKKLETPTIISEGTYTQGNLEFIQETHLYGTVEGGIRVNTQDKLIIGPSAWLKGDIHSEGEVFILGKVEGKVQSKMRIEVGSQGYVEGTLMAPIIVIKEGAFIQAEYFRTPESTHSTHSRVLDKTG